jgi:hypothetical protein
MEVLNFWEIVVWRVSVGERRGRPRKTKSVRAAIEVWLRWDRRDDVWVI